MKTLHLSIIVIMVLAFSETSLVFAIPGMSPSDLYKQSDMVFHGQVIS